MKKKRYDLHSPAVPGVKINVKVEKSGLQSRKPQRFAYGIILLANKPQFILWLIKI